MDDASNDLSCLIKDESSTDFSGGSFFTTMSTDFDSSLADFSITKDVTMTSSILTESSASGSTINSSNSNKSETVTLTSDVSPSTSFYDSSMAETKTVKKSVSRRKSRSTAGAALLDSREGSSRLSDKACSEAASSLLDQILIEPKKIFDVSLSSTSGKRMIDLILDQLPSKRIKTEEPMEIVSLPPDLLVKIFNFVPTDDVLSSVVRVCKLFNDVSKRPDLRLSVKIGRGRRLFQPSLVI